MGFPGSVLLNQGDIYKQTSDQRHPLGTRGYTRDGRVFRYARAGATALTVGLLHQAAAVDTDYNIDLNPATSTAPTTASTAITLELATAATIAEDELKDGILYINDGTGEGQYVMIVGNAANTGAATGTFDVYIREGDSFTVAPTTSCEMGCSKNKYDDVVLQVASAHTNVLLGVTPRAVSIAYYFWLQTWGPCPIKTEGTVTQGDPVFFDTGSATVSSGVVHKVTTSTDTAAWGASSMGFKAGNVLQVGATGDTSLIDLQISP